MPQELNSCLYQSPYGEIGFVIFVLLIVTEPLNEVEDLTVHPTGKSNLNLNGKGASDGR